jgi:tetratricopeptide (TPR) repeat protein
MEPDWPEHLKTVAIMGGHVSGLGTTAQKRVSSALNLQLLAELHTLAHADQKRAIEQMQAAAYFAFALIEIEENDFEAALVHTQRQLAQLEKISTVSGEHILITPLESNGNILSQLNRYKEASVLYERAMDIVTRLYGSEHVGLATLSMNCGISLYMHSKSILGKLSTWSADKQGRALKKSSALLARSKELLMKSDRLLSGYDGEQQQGNLRHLKMYLQKVNDALKQVQELEFEDEF